MIMKFEGFLSRFTVNNDRDYNNTGTKFKKFGYKGVSVGLQPGVSVSKELTNGVLDMMIEISRGYYLVYNQCEIYKKRYLHDNSAYHYHLKFRISDMNGDSEYGTEPGRVPFDILAEIKSKCKKVFGGLQFDFEDFDDRGYVLIDVIYKL